MPVSHLGYVNTISEPTASGDKRSLLAKDPMVPMLRSALQSLALPIRTVKPVLKNLQNSRRECSLKLYEAIRQSSGTYASVGIATSYFAS